MPEEQSLARLARLKAAWHTKQPGKEEPGLPCKP